MIFGALLSLGAKYSTSSFHVGKLQDNTDIVLPDVTSD
jgi:hypothetical protein